MKIAVFATLLFGLLCARSHASFLDDIINTVEKVAKDTATEIVAEKTEEMLRDMLIDYTSEQTKTDEEVSREYEEENGSLPDRTFLAAYRTEISPGRSVTPGTRVMIKSVIEVVPGKDGRNVDIEERLTIFDNEDNDLALKSMTKKAGKRTGKGGEFYGEFTFSLPEGMPQGVYPIQTTLLLNGDLVGDDSHMLQLVLILDYSDGGELVAALHKPYQTTGRRWEYR